MNVGLCWVLRRPIETTHDFGKFITKLPLTPAVEPAPFSMKFVRRAKG
jgi:hypothetical protein